MNLFDGVRVIDLSRLLAGPYCGQLLSDLGAEVIKVEPLAGDDSRLLGTFFFTANGGKTSIAVDITRPEGRDVLLRLVRDADVLVENFRPTVKHNLGFDYESIAKLNPKIVYCSISAFGQSGPLSDRPGVDTVFQAMSGILGVIGKEEAPPTKVGAPLGDIAAANTAAFAIAAALFQRERTGAGTFIEVSIRDALVALLNPVVSHTLMTGEEPPKLGNASQFAAPADIFPTGDGLIAISTINNRQWQRLCAALGASHLAEAPRFRENESRLRHRADLTLALREIFETQSTAYWEEKLKGSGVPFGPVMGFSDLTTDPQLNDGLFVDVAGQGSDNGRMVGLPFHIGGQALKQRSAPPSIGQHSESTLIHLGYAPQEITELFERGVVRTEAQAAKPVNRAVTAGTPS